jgi:hypothetical protein
MASEDRFSSGQAPNGQMVRMNTDDSIKTGL